MFEDLRELAVEYALSFLNFPYVYNRQSPFIGFDCSGLMVEVLRGVGLLKLKEDLSAESLCFKFSKNSCVQPKPGCLLFFGKDPNHIEHVGMCIHVDREIGPIMIEAGGGDSTTTTPELAKQRDARVRIRPMMSRSDYVCAVNPFGA